MMRAKAKHRLRGWLGALLGCVVTDIGFRYYGLLGSVGALVAFGAVLAVYLFLKQQRLERRYHQFKGSNPEQKRSLIISSGVDAVEYFEERVKQDGLNWDSICSPD